MNRAILILVVLAGAASAPPSARAASVSLEKCADLSASAQDVAHHCRRALANDRLSGDQALAAGLNLGDALLTLGRAEDALDAFDAAAANGRERVELYLGRADAHETLGRRREAAGDLDRALALAPGSRDVRLARGAFYLGAGAADAAFEEFDAAVRLDPDDADARFNRGVALIALSRGAEAERDFTAVLRDYPKDAGAYLQRGRARDGRDDAGALADYEKAAALAPEWTDPVFLAGRLLDRTGRVEAANARFRRAFELGYRDPWLLERIRSLGG